MLAAKIAALKARAATQGGDTPAAERGADHAGGRAISIAHVDKASTVRTRVDKAGTVNVSVEKSNTSTVLVSEPLVAPGSDLWLDDDEQDEILALLDSEPTPKRVLGAAPLGGKPNHMHTLGSEQSPLRASFAPHGFGSLCGSQGEPNGAQSGQNARTGPAIRCAETPPRAPSLSSLLASSPPDATPGDLLALGGAPPVCRVTLESTAERRSATLLPAIETHAAYGTCSIAVACDPPAASKHATETVLFLPQPILPAECTSAKLRDICATVIARGDPLGLLSSTEPVPLASITSRAFTAVRAPLIVATVRDVCYATPSGDHAVLLADESWPSGIPATLDGAVAAGGRRVHFGMTLVLRDVLVFRGEHLVVAPRNVVLVYANVHFV